MNSKGEGENAGISYLAFFSHKAILCILQFPVNLPQAGRAVPKDMHTANYSGQEGSKLVPGL